MGRRSRFPVIGQLDRVRPTRGTVTVDRAAGLFEVRPYRSRKTYTLPLSTVAEIVVQKIIMAEVAERRAAKRKKRRKK